jgi:hypothetical protein
MTGAEVTEGFTPLAERVGAIDDGQQWPASNRSFSVIVDVRGIPDIKGSSTCLVWNSGRELNN